MTLTEQRAKRIEELKIAMLAMVRQHHPEVSPELTVEITPNAAIDLFGMGVIDSTEEDWQKFLESLRTAEPVPIGDEDIPEEAMAELKKITKGN